MVKEGKGPMNGDRRKLGTNLVILGAVLFLIGMFDNSISDMIVNLNNDIRIFGWGWILQIIGGITAIYGFMIHFEIYLAANRPPPQPGLPHPLQHLYFMDHETKKMIWIVLVIILVLYIVSPGTQCFTLIIILMVLIMFLSMRGGIGPRFPFPPPQYPPPQQPPYQPPSASPPPSAKVTLCKKCYAQLELNWVACPFCGHSKAPKKEDKNE